MGASTKHPTWKTMPSDVLTAYVTGRCPAVQCFIHDYIGTVDGEEHFYAWARAVDASYSLHERVWYDLDTRNRADEVLEYIYNNKGYGLKFATEFLDRVKERIVIMEAKIARIIYKEEQLECPVTGAKK